MTTITLGEGNTALSAPGSAAARLRLWLECEGTNPTGSFKDRGIAVAVTRAVERGVTRLVFASSGARHRPPPAAPSPAGGIEAVIVVPAGAIAASKLVQVRAVGGRIVEIEGSFSDAFAHAEQLAAEPGSTFVNSGGSEDRIEGQMSVAPEIVDQLGGVPDVVTLPYGGGGNTRAIARGFEELVGEVPRLYPVEAARRPDTVASAIRIVDPLHATWVREAIERSGGELVTVSDDEILDAWKNLRTLEGVFSEPASAAGIAGLAHIPVADGERVVCIVTGHGLKDPAAVEA